MLGKINKRTVDAARSGARDDFIWDRDLAGFGLKVTVSGAKVYVLQYRAGGRGSPIRRYTIGKHGAPWTPEEARKEARRLLGEIAKGGDPASEKSAKRAGSTILELAERFMAEHVRTKTKPRSVAEYDRLVTKLILPALGKRKVADVNRSDVARLHHELRGTPYQANRVLAILSKMFSLAERWGMRPDNTNPCRHFDRFREDKRERFLSEVELVQLSEALVAAEQEGTASPYAVAAIRLLLFTGARLSEILTLRWQDVDFDTGVLRLPDSKTGAKLIHLSAPPREVLTGLQRDAGNPFVIAGANDGAHLVNLEKPWRRIRSTAGLQDVRLHDLRHSFASVAVAGGLSLPIIGALLGHKNASTTARYAHLAADPLKRANDLIAERMTGAMKGQSGHVVPFARPTQNRP